MNLEGFFKGIIQDVAVDTFDGMDRNFERKAFFTKQWPARKSKTAKGTMMMVSGALRGGNRVDVSGNSITNSMPYAKIHNEGGKIKVTQKMKNFFWAMHIKASNASVGGGKAREEAMTEEAKMWKAMALMKIGSEIVIPQRQFIGWDPQLRTNIDQIVGSHLKELDIQIRNSLKQ